MKRPLHLKRNSLALLRALYRRQPQQRRLLPIEGLAAECKISPRTALRHIRYLEGAQIIKVNRYDRPHSYTINPAGYEILDLEKAYVHEP